MSKLETLYNSIEGLKELGLPLNEETLKAVDNLEEELIKNEVIPRLSSSIEPIITQIQRPIVLVVDYVPGESLSVRLTRKRVIMDESETKEYSLAPKTKEHEKKTDKTITSSPKSAWTGLMVTFPNGKVINNRYAYETLIEVVEKVGVQKVESLGLKHLGLDFISKKRDDFYNQHELPGGYLILTHSSTDKKKRQIEEISQKLNLELKVEVV
ncbi:MAG: hypothetical protein PHS59_01400 [Paludibacter sp.]|nr:hypothetical protein [Paludibacter sp.]